MSSQVTIQRETVTPAIAAEWLGTMHLNRRLRKPLADRYGKAMQAEDWQDTGESVKFNEDGTLIDGQHRLTPIRDLGLTMDLWVARGLSHEAQVALDGGSKRTVSDVLHMRGIENSNILAAALNVLYRFENDTEARWGSQHAVTASRAIEMLGHHTGLPASIPYGVRAYHANPVLPPGLATALHFILAGLSEDDASEFFDRLTDGVGLPQGSPILRLRELLTKLNSDRQRSGKRGDKVYVQAITTKAWNAFRAGTLYTESQSLRWTGGGRKPEPFPKPQ